MRTILVWVGTGAWTVAMAVAAATGQGRLLILLIAPLVIAVAFGSVFANAFDAAAAAVTGWAADRRGRRLRLVRQQEIVALDAMFRAPSATARR